MVSIKNLCSLIWFLLQYVQSKCWTFGVQKKTFGAWKSVDQRKVLLFIRFFLSGLAWRFRWYENPGFMEEMWHRVAWREVLCVTADTCRLWNSGYQSQPPQRDRQMSEPDPADHTEGPHLCWCKREMNLSCQTPEGETRYMEWVLCFFSLNKFEWDLFASLWEVVLGGGISLEHLIGQKSV